MLGENDSNIIEHVIPKQSFYSSIKDFTSFSHFAIEKDGSASYNFNACCCYNCVERQGDCMHPLQKGNIHGFVMQKVVTTGGFANLISPGGSINKKMMEMPKNVDGVLSTIGENGQDERKLNKGTIVVSLTWSEEAKKSSIRVGYLSDVLV